MTDEEPSAASAVTRSWSDLNHTKLMLTFGFTSLFYSTLGQPFFLVIARQQISAQRLSGLQIFREAVQRDGWRSLFRGTGVSVSGTVLSELMYYFCLEYWKEQLPLKERESRSFWAGFCAETTSTLVFNPFAVVSQIQMVATPKPVHCPYPYMTASSTLRAVVKDNGLKSLFRGTLITLFVAPVAGGWWYVYEAVKRNAYHVAPYILDEVLPAACLKRLPACCVSLTDNAVINSTVGALTNMLFCFLMNPVYVLRLRVQAMPCAGRWPLRSAAANILRKEGARALWKGLGINMSLAALGGFTFGLAYEGTKLISDKRP